MTPSSAASPTFSYIPLMTRPLPHLVLSTVNSVIPIRIPSLFTTCQSVVCFLNASYLLNTLPQPPQMVEEWVQVVPSDSAFTLSQSASLAQHDGPVAPPVSPTFYQMPGTPQVSHYFLLCQERRITRWPVGPYYLDSLYEILTTSRHPILMIPPSTSRCPVHPKSVHFSLMAYLLLTCSVDMALRSQS